MPDSTPQGMGLVLTLRVETAPAPQSDAEAAYRQRLMDMTRRPSKAQLARREAEREDG